MAIEIKIDTGKIEKALQNLPKLVPRLTATNLFGKRTENAIFESNKRNILGITGPPLSPQYARFKERAKQQGKAVRGRTVIGGPNDFDILTGVLFDAVTGADNQFVEIDRSDPLQFRITISVPYAAFVQAGPRPFFGLSPDDIEQITNDAQSAVDDILEFIFG